MWKWLIGGGVAAWLVSAVSGVSDANGSVGSRLSVDPLFEVFWQVVGREESWCRYDAWNADDVGSGVSVGWIQFNQRSGLLYLLEVAMRSPADFAGAFGVYASRFANVGWVRSANLNQPVYKRILLGFLVSNFGRECQRMAAYRYYWRPAQDYIDTNRVEGVSDLYRVLVGSCAVQFAPAVWQGWIALHGTAQKLNDAAGAYLRAKGHHTIAQHRMPRQMSNAKKALLGQFSCHP